MEQEAVRRKQWLTHAAFLDLLGATNLIPGPGSTQMAIGYRRAGWAGLVLGGTCFILPAAALTLGFAWGYVRYGRLPQVQGLLHGMKPVVLAIVVQALWGLGRTAFRTRALAILGVFLPRLRRSPATAGFLDGINVGALAVMAAVTWFLSRAALVDVPTLLLGLVSVVLLIRFRPNPSWLILGGGVAGLLLR